jgi:methionyl-tRNA formyltransferase
LRIAFAGTPEFAVPALDALAASRHELVGILTQPDRPAGRGRVLTASPVKHRALQLGLSLAQPERLVTEEQRAALRAWQPELLVVVAYGLILPPAALQLPRLGCLNIHASLLPRWRGAAPIARAILAGDAATGVAIMALESTLDTGPVYAQRRIAISARDAAADLLPGLAAQGASALIEVIDALAAGTAVARAQELAGVTYAHKLNKEEAVIDWQDSATNISRQVRAFNPWPVAETLLRGERVRVWRAWDHDSAGTATATAAANTSAAVVPAAAVPGTVLGLHAGTLQVQCGQGVLAIEALQLPGKRAVSAADFAHARDIGKLRFGATA